jgi:hypothetical protein
MTISSIDSHHTQDDESDDKSQRHHHQHFERYDNTIIDSISLWLTSLGMISYLGDVLHWISKRPWMVATDVIRQLAMPDHHRAYLVCPSILIIHQSINHSINRPSSFLFVDMTICVCYSCITSCD